MLNTKINVELILSSRCNSTFGYINMCHILLRINSFSLFMRHIYKILVLDETSLFQSYQL